jgi:hypothetical protein
MIAGDPNKPVAIQLQLAQSPEWLQPNVTVNHISLPTDRAEKIRQGIVGETRRFKVEQRYRPPPIPLV